jgi:chaperonin GroES
VNSASGVFPPPHAINRCKSFNASDLKIDRRSWHVIRFLPAPTVCLLQIWPLGIQRTLNQLGLIGVNLSFHIIERRLTGQEKVMAKKASASGTRIVPLGDRVVLKRAEAEEKTAGGILLPDSAQGKPQRGEVVSIGDGYVNDKGEKVALTVKEGDRVIFSSYAGDEIILGDQTYLLMRESDILATV